MESDGTEISDDEVVVELRQEKLILLQPNEKWTPAQEMILECGTAIASGSASGSLSDGSTITITSDMEVDQETFLENDNRIIQVNDTEHAAETTREEQNFIILQVPADDTPNLTQPLNNSITEYTWESFEIPWCKIPNYMLIQCETKNAEKSVVKEIIHMVVNEMRGIKTAIPNKAFKCVAKKMADKYPKTFLDTDEDGNVLGSGVSTTVSQLQDRNWYLNRSHKRAVEFIKPKIPAKKLKDLNNRKAGCSSLNWQPSHSKADIRESKTLLNSINSDHPKFTELLEETYSAQRQFLANPNQPTIAEIKEEWPALFLKYAIIWHFKKLTEKELPAENISKLEKIVSYGKNKKMNICETDDLVLQALKVSAESFKEEIGSFFFQFKVSFVCFSFFDLKVLHCSYKITMF